MEHRRENVLSGIELETDSGRNSASGLIWTIVAVLVIGFVAFLVFGV